MGTLGASKWMYILSNGDLALLQAILQRDKGA